MRILKSLLLIPLFWLNKPATAQNTEQNSLLYEISGNGLASPSYLFGTMHMINNKDFFVPKSADSVMALSQKVVFELDLMDPAIITTIQNWSKLPDAKTWKDYIPESEYTGLLQYIKDSLHLNPDDYVGLKPFVLYQLITQLTMGEDPASYEGYFLTAALGSGKSIAGLENLTDQLHIFDSIPYAEQIKWMIDGSAAPQSQDTLMSTMVKLYKEADLDALLQYTMTSSPEMRYYQDLFLTERNKNWIPKITQFAQNNSTFVAVGAAHLPGENGVIALLQKAGYTCKPL